MAIEERELSFSPDSPLRAWRLFRVRVLDGDAVLSSPMYHDPDPPPWPNVSSVTFCYRCHPAPAAGCPLPSACWPDEVALETATRMLRERYGVPVGGLDDVPDWVTGNQRARGMPPGEVNVDLDVNRLDLG